MDRGDISFQCPWTPTLKTEGYCNLRGSIAVGRVVGLVAHSSQLIELTVRHNMITDVSHSPLLRDAFVTSGEALETNNNSSEKTINELKEKLLIAINSLIVSQPRRLILEIDIIISNGASYDAALLAITVALMRSGLSVSDIHVGSKALIIGSPEDSEKILTEARSVLKSIDNNSIGFDPSVYFDYTLATSESKPKKSVVNNISIVSARDILAATLKIIKRADGTELVYWPYPCLTDDNNLDGILISGVLHSESSSFYDISVKLNKKTNKIDWSDVQLTLEDLSQSIMSELAFEISSAMSR